MPAVILSVKYVNKCKIFVPYILNWTIFMVKIKALDNQDNTLKHIISIYAFYEMKLSKA